eukprot:m.6732 g.6732  ORF g.6732 m.6732 type:complete len:262 (-) comp4367_c0_seq1:303-1088(-)
MKHSEAQARDAFRRTSPCVFVWTVVCVPVLASIVATCTAAAAMQGVSSCGQQAVIGLDDEGKMMLADCHNSTSLRRLMERLDALESTAERQESIIQQLNETNSQQQQQISQLQLALLNSTSQSPPLPSIRLFSDYEVTYSGSPVTVNNWQLWHSQGNISFSNTFIRILERGVYLVGLKILAFTAGTSSPTSFHGWIYSPNQQHAGRVVSWDFQTETRRVQTALPTTIVELEAGSVLSVVIQIGQLDFTPANPHEFFAAKLS